MFMHDHEKPREDPEWCPLMKEVCTKGRTPSMGTARCKAWQPVTVVDPRATPQQREVYDCSIFGWPPDLAVQTANETYHNAVATEQVRNKVAEQNGMNQIALAFLQGIAKRFRAAVSLPDLSKRNELPDHTNGNNKGAS